MNNKRINIHFVLIILAATLWGTAGIFVYMAKKYSLSEMQLVFGRALFTTAIVGIITVFKNKSYFKIRFKDLWLFMAAGLFSIVLFNFCYYKTMSLASLSVAAVLLYTAPFFVVIISRFVFRIKLTANKLIACFIAFIGCAFVSGILDADNRISGQAFFFGLLTGLGYALYTIFGELLLKRGYSSLTITFYIFLFAGIFCLPLINVSNTLKYVILEPRALAVLFLMALFNTVIPYLLYTTGLQRVDPSVAPIIATVEPVVATVVGVLIFSQKITIWGVIGIALVLSSVVILNLKVIRVKANAKINLILSVNGKREDGYHLIDTVMQSISLGDILKISPSKNLSLKCNIKELEGCENIAYKAAELFFKETGIDGGAKITIKKNIPMAAGLGGGSADAAAVLLALNKLYSAGLSNQRLEEIALCLGADVPFFIKGGTVRAEGIGERLTKLNTLERGYFILAKADKKQSTGEMYKRLDNENPEPLEVDVFIAFLNEGDYDRAITLFDNSFCLAWQNNALEKRLKELSPNALSLSGSGPTFFAYFTDKRSAQKAYKELRLQKIECYLVKPIDKAIEIE